MTSVSDATLDEIAGWLDEALHEHVSYETAQRVLSALDPWRIAAMIEGAQLMQEAAAKGVIGYIHPDPDGNNMPLFASRAVRALDPAEIVKGKSDE